eukprot:Gb_15872 [translate_table: standard]
MHHISWMDMVIKRFYDKSGLPNYCGEIDAMHITITKPYGVDCADYYNRKQSYSIIFQGVCDTNRRFLDVFCGFLGLVHDSRILQNSSLYKCAEDKDILHGKPIYMNFGFKVGQYLLGDAGYPCLPWLIVPFPGKDLPMAKQNYNKRYSLRRLHIEQTFGILKRVFIILGGTFTQKVSFIPELILYYCILHNVLLDKNEIDISTLL